MKTKTYRYGDRYWKLYMKPVGNKEATDWYTHLHHEIKNFTKRYPQSAHYPASWFKHFAKDYFYKCYYRYLDGLFARYKRDYDRAVSKDVKKFHYWKEHHYRKAA